MSNRIVAYIGIGVLCWYLLSRRPASETYGQPVLTELDFGKNTGVLGTPGTLTPKDIIRQRTSAFQTEDGARIEYFFDDEPERDPSDPLHATYKRLADTNVNTNVFGPRSWDDKKRFDDTGALAYNVL